MIAIFPNHDRAQPLADRSSRVNFAALDIGSGADCEPYVRALAIIAWRLD